MASSKNSSSSRGYWLALLGLFVLGLALRLFRLGSVPLGGHGDVAWIGLNALDWLHDGIWPYYVYELYAPEPGIVYAAGLSIAAFGANFFASRLPTSLASALVIPVSYFAIRWLKDDDKSNEVVGAQGFVPLSGWLAALAYAVSFYPIILSKTGQRAQLFPLLVMGLVALFAYAWKSGKWWAFMASAVVIALANYTYIPARLMPVMVILWAVHQFFADRERFKTRFWQLVAMGGLSALLVLPQLITYLNTPEAFFARSNQTAGQFIFQTGLSGAELWGTLGRKFVGEFAIFFLPWRGAYAEMGRPLMPLPLAIGAVIAIVVTFFKGKDRGLWWPLIGLPVMFLTDVVSGTQPEPHGLRMIGVLPLVFLLAGQGLALGGKWLKEQLKLSPPFNTAIPVILALLILIPGLNDLWFYHQLYIPNQQADPETTDRLEISDVLIAELALKHSGDGRPILLTLDDFTRANIPYLLSDAYPVRRGLRESDDLDRLDGSVLVVYPSNPYRPRHDGRLPEHDGRSWVMLVDGEMLLLPTLSVEAAELIDLSPENRIDVIADATGQEVASLYEIPAGGLFSSDESMTVVGANFSNEIELVEYSVDSHILDPGGELWITLYWHRLEGASEDYETFVQILDAQGQAIAQVHRWTLDGVYRTRLWDQDELVPTRFRLDVPPELPAGRYTVIAGLYRVLHNESLPVVDDQGSAPHATLSGFKVALPPANPTQPAPEQEILFGDMIRLIGLGAETTTDSLILRADWQAIDYSAADHTLFIHVVDAEENIVGQLDTQPRYGSYPTGIWDVDEVVPDEYVLPIGDLPAGDYTVYMGWYTLPGGERLSATANGETAPDNRIAIFEFSRP